MLAAPWTYWLHIARNVLKVSSPIAQKTLEICTFSYPKNSLIAMSRIYTYKVILFQHDDVGTVYSVYTTRLKVMYTC